MMFVTQSPLPRVLAVATLWLVAGDSLAASPEITHTRPLGIRQGQSGTITFYGARLGDTHQVLSSDPRLAVQNVVVDQDKVNVTFACQADLPCGLVPVRLVTQTGISNVRRIAVGQFDVIAEAEPNGPTDPPQPILPPCTIEGVVDREDIDRFELTMTAGQTCKLEIEAIRLQFTLQNRAVVDPVLRVTDEAGFEVVRSDDHTLLRQDSVCAFTAPADGVYLISVHESSFGGDKSAGGYRLHVGNFPRPVTVHPAAGTAGSELVATLTDIDGTTRDVTLSLPSEPDPLFEVHDRFELPGSTGAVSSPSPNIVRVEPHPVLTEPDGAQGLPADQAAAVPVTFCGVVEDGQSDRFYIQCGEKQSLWINLYAREPFRSPLDGVVSLLDPAGKFVKSSDDMAGNLDGSFEFQTDKAGDYQLLVRDHLHGGSPRHNYALAVTLKKPMLRLEAKELDRDASASLPIAVGRHHAVVIRAQRFGFDEAIDLELLNLPDGVTATTWPMQKGMAEIPVLLSASPDAALGGHVFDLVGTVADRPELRTELSQHHKMVLGRNRREMVGLETPGLALAVTEAVPFEVSIDQPKTPVLRSGSKSLTVRVVRDEGFEDEIHFRSLYNPPGVTINNSRKIEKGAVSVDIPLTANAKANLGDWPIILLARYSRPLGTRELAAPAINLTVQEAIFDVKFLPATGQLGQNARLGVELTKRRDFEGVVSVAVEGLPKGVTGGEAREVELKDQTVMFELAIGTDAHPGLQKTLVLQTTVQREGETVSQTDGGGELRINPAPPTPPIETPPTETPAPPVERPLSRLEQLRQQKETVQ